MKKPKLLNPNIFDNYRTEARAVGVFIHRVRVRERLRDPKSIDDARESLRFMRLFVYRMIMLLALVFAGIGGLVLAALLYLFSEVFGVLSFGTGVEAVAAAGAFVLAFLVVSTVGAFGVIVWVSRRWPKGWKNQTEFGAGDPF